MEALGNGRPYSDGVPILIAALHDRDAGVRRAAARGLGAPGAGAAVPELIRLLADPDDDVRSAAAVALGLIGRAAASAIPALRAVIPENPEAADAVRNIKWWLRRTDR
jgi:HEAT repeat protein